MLAVHEQRLKDKNIYIRSTYPAVHAGTARVKASVLAATGGRSFKKRLEEKGIRHNSCFAGIYDFAPDVDYRVLFQRWLAAAPDDTLIMCHPALEHSSNDPHPQSRWLEWQYFSSNDFLNDCQAQGIRLARVSEA